MGIQYQYKRLDNTNFTAHSLDDFVRHKTVTECWRKINNDCKLVPNAYEEKWSLAQYNGPAVKTKKEEIYREQLLI